MQHDPRIDAYIAKAQPFAQPILTRLRAAVHEACPDVEETLKWGMPHWTHQGRILVYGAAFKAHAAFGFGHGEQVVSTGKGGEAMGQFGRLTSVADLPAPTKLRALVKKAVKLIDAGAKAARAPKTGDDKPAPSVPAGLAAALRREPKARAFFATLAPSHQREYTDWITEAKQAATRERRLAQAVEWLAEGKRRNWKYETRSR